MQLRLTKLTQLHGCSCKLRQKDLWELLSGIECSGSNILFGIGDDAGAIKVQKGVAYVTHLDFFTPILDDPFTYGKIAACNAASDVFAKGAIENLGILTIMGFPAHFPLKIIRKILRGVCDFCKDVGAVVLGGHTIVNPWPIVGAAVTATAAPERLIRNSTACQGDVLVLTKPLGVQPVMAALRTPRRYLVKTISYEKLKKVTDLAVKSMLMPNLKAAECLLEVAVHAATDVTGFGILGQARTMAKSSNVNIEIHTLPVFEGALELSNLLGYGLADGRSAETSGGLLISVSSQQQTNLLESLRRKHVPAYVVGEVKRGNGKAYLRKNPEITIVRDLNSDLST